MAERRMFAKKIVDSDAFVDMSLSAQALYLHLGLAADDDGFVGNPKQIVRSVGASEDDMRELLDYDFVYMFPSGVVLIKHWKVNNLIRKDRYTETMYLEEKSAISTDETNVYVWLTHMG